MQQAIDMLGKDFGFKPVDHEETIYVLVDYNEIIYVGRTTTLDERIKQHKRRGINFEAVFYKSFPNEITDFVEFYLINVLNPKENKADVLNGNIYLGRFINYFHRFTNGEFLHQGITPLFETANIPYSDVYEYDVDDLLDLCLVGFNEMNTDYEDYDLKFICNWRDKNENKQKEL